MPALHIENIPEDLLEALRSRAKRNGTSVAEEVISAIRRDVQVRGKLNSRKAAIDSLKAMRAESSPGRGPFQASEELLREDRAR